LKPIKGSTRFLSTNTSGASSIAISPDGRYLVVVERLTNNIDVFGINADGTLASININSSAGPGAFAAAFGRNGTLIVSETGAQGVPNGSAVSSYSIGANGKLFPITTSLPTLGAANCWNAVTPDGRFVYNSNAGTSTIAGFAVADKGTLSPLPGTLVGVNPSGTTNLDIAISADGKFLYSLNDGAATVGIFAIQDDGTLLSAGNASGLAVHAGFNGIAAN
jgi:6-phosphogluconolactonase (cycloisomerase 2 family)